MTIEELIEQIRTAPDSVEFDEVMHVIEENYDYSPTGFTVGDVINEAGSNEGSCKILHFAQQNNLSEVETLVLFGKYYREDVLGDPGGEDHPNIRNFILDGWLGTKFERAALAPKEASKYLAGPDSR